MVSKEIISIRENLLSRSDEITIRWYNGAVQVTNLHRNTHEEIKVTMKKAVNEAIETITSDIFTPSKAIEIGEKISKLKLGNSDFIGRTQEILSFEFTNELSKDELLLVHHILSSFIANFTSGYINNARNDFMNSQKIIYENLMQDLLIVDEKLKKTNAELEAMVEERTGELKSLNEELKKEIEIRISAEDHLKQREYLLSVAFDTSFLWTGLLDPQGRILLPNKTSIDFIGLKKEDVIGQYFWEAPWWSHSPELSEKVKKAIMRARKGAPSQFDVVHVDPEGNHQDVQFSIRPVKNQEGEVIYLIPEGVNVTKRKNAERELKRTRDELKGLLENTNDIYFSVNGEGILTFIGPQIKKFGTDPEDIIGKSFFSLLSALHPDDIEGLKRMFERRFNDMDETPNTYRILDPKGGILWFEESSKLITDENGNVISVNGILRDITPRKEYEEELQNLNEVLRLINKIMRHDINNRLSAAHGILGLMMEKKTYDPKIIEPINIAIKGSIDLTKRMADLEKLAQGSEGLKEFDLRSVIPPIVKEYPIESNITGNSRVLADDALISVFDNLVSNAVTHGGAKRVDFDITEIDEECWIKISNDGAPIPDSITDLLFDESFSWGDRKGSGLGLFISKKLIERYGGKISLTDSEDGKTVFEIRLSIISK